MLPFRTLPVLPTDSDLPIVAFPSAPASETPEGFFVEFTGNDDRRWVGNFRKGSTALSRITDHPNGRDLTVIAGGAVWIVDLTQRTARQVCSDAVDVWRMLNPDRFVVVGSRSVLCLDAGGERWRTPELSQRAGLGEHRMEGERLHGSAWAVVTQAWVPFTINLQDGAVYDGSGGRPETPFDFARTAGLDQAPPLSPAGQRQLAIIRGLRRAAFSSLLALPGVVIALAAVNKISRGSTAIFVSGASWTNVFWSTLFYLMAAGVLLAMFTVSRRCPRCENGFFVSKGYTRHGPSTQSRGSVNIFARRCLNCRLPLKGA